ncbi:MAG: Ig-like domain-containing protein [Bacteroidota bacterium]
MEKLHIEIRIKVFCLVSLIILYFTPFKEVKSQDITVRIFGQNAWMPASIGTTSYPGKLNSQWRKVKDSKAGTVRYGGNAADMYISTHTQYLNIIDSIRGNGMEPIIQVSYYNNKYTASQAAEIVEFINVTSVRNVKYWVIGNEPDVSYGNINAAEVANYVKAFSLAMKNKDSSIKIIAPETGWYNKNILDGLTTPGGSNDITGKDANGNFIVDIISFHLFAFNGTQTRSKVISYLTTPGLFEDNLTELNQRIAACNNYHQRNLNSALGIAVTEANIMWKKLQGDDIYDLGASSFIAGQFWTEIIGICMKKNVSLLNFWSVIEGSELGYLNDQSTLPKPTYYHFQMLADNFKGKFCNGTDNETNVKCYGSKQDDQISVIIMNQDQSNDFIYTLRLDTDLISGTDPLKINIDADIGIEYNDTLFRESSVLLTLKSNGTLIKKCVYKLRGNADNDLSPTCTIEAAKLAVPSTSKTFAVIGDYGLSGSNEAAVANLVKSWNPGYIITLGDNNYELGESSTIDANIGQYYHDFIYPYSGSYGAGADSNRFFPSLGNHDLNTNNGAPYLQYFTLPGNERYYDFIKDNIHFFVLNSDPREADGNDSSSIQALWLKDKLQNSTSKWKVVYFHHSPYCSDATQGSQAYMQWPFKKWGAHVVLSGHSHVYERLIVDGFPYFVGGVGGKSLYAFKSTPLPESVFRYNSNFGAILCNEYSDTLTFRFYNKAGTLIDSYLLTRNLGPLDVVISSPPNNATFSFGTPVVINATVTGGLGGINKVDFYSDTTKLGTDSTYPFSFTWTNAPLGSHSLTASVTDNSNDSVSSLPSNITVVMSCTSTGKITRDFWANVSGTSIASVPVNTAPTSITQLSVFEGPSNVADNYGSRIRGYICPPISGNYTFWIASDDNSELWLSSNDQIFNKVKIALVSGFTSSRQWTKYADQQSAPIPLIAGTQYYIEAIHKEGTQGDNLAVGWQLPNGALERPIPAARLSPIVFPLTATISSPTNNSSFISGSSFTIQADVSGGTGTIQKVEFFADSTKLGEDATSPYSFIWNNVTQGNYELTAKVTDSENDTALSPIIIISVIAPVTCSATGSISREVWNSISGSGVSSIPVSTQPNSTGQLTIFQAPENAGDNYGQRIRGYVCPPVTGNYIFWIASDDNSELWLSTDDNPTNKQKIASVTGYTAPLQWTKYSTQQSVSKNLIAGQKYYIEVLHKEATQGDNCAVGWQLPNGTLERPIPGTRLSPFNIPLLTNISSPVNNSSFNAGSNITIQAVATGGTGTIQKVEFFADSTKIGEDGTSPFSLTWNNVIEGNYDLTVKSTDSGNNSAVSVKVTISVIPIVTCSATGSIAREVWSNVSGSSVSAIPLGVNPSLTGQLSIFEAPQNFANNYGQRISGYVCPPVTGNYIFWIASDNSSELWLSTNDTPANKQKIASVSGYTSSRQWTKYSTQKSVSKSLIAGQKYYIEALHKESDQGDNCAVGWQLPSGVLERPIPGNRLSAFQLIPSVELISAGSSWKYLDNGTNQGTAWRTTSFNDATWKTGNAEFGYGDGGEATIVSYGPSSTNKYITTYFRKSFNVSDISTISGLELSLIRDDGAVVYINGVEVYRNNMPSGTIFYNTLAPTIIDASKESIYVIANISSSSLINGTNRIAVEIHQNAVTTPDMSFNLKLKTLSGSRIMDSEITNDTTQQNIISDTTYKMIVYPNPNTGQFNLELCIDDLQEKIVIIEVTNSFGIVVYKKQPQNIKGCVKEEIQMESTLSSGLYILKVTIDDKIQTSKMLLTR